jgi:hypothetical protein
VNKTSPLGWDIHIGNSIHRFIDVHINVCSITTGTIRVG